MNCSRFGPILAPVGATGLGESASVAGVVIGLVTKGLLGLGCGFVGLALTFSTTVFSRGGCLGLGDVAAEGVLELGREEGRVAGEGTEELGFNSSPNSPGAKVTTEQNPSELDTTRILPQGLQARSVRPV